MYTGPVFVNVLINLVSIVGINFLTLHRKNNYNFNMQGETQVLINV